MHIAKYLASMALAVLTLPGKPASAQLSCSTTRQTASQPDHTAGTWEGRISGDGQSIAFRSVSMIFVGLPASSSNQVFHKDIASGQYRLVSRAQGPLAGANGNSDDLTISNDGRYVAFYSLSTNLDADVNGPGCFRWDSQTGEIQRADLRPDGLAPNKWGRDPAISPDGRYVAFRSTATDLVVPTLNPPHIFLRDMESNQVWRVSEAAPGIEQHGGSVSVPEVSANGDYVVYRGTATNLLGGAWIGPAVNSNVFVWERATGNVNSPTNDLGQIASGSNADEPQISDDGRYVVFTDQRDYLVPGDPGFVDVFLADLSTGTLTRVTTPPGGGGAGANCWRGMLSGDGGTVVFETTSSLFDLTGVGGYDIFAYNVGSGQFTPVDVGSDGSPDLTSASNAADVSYDGSRFIWQSPDASIAPGDTNGALDILMRSCQPTAPPIFYCTAKTSSASCIAQVATNDPLEGPASEAGDYTVVANAVQGGKNGIFFFGTFGPAAVPFLNGLLCVQPPVMRTMIQASHGTSPLTCDGSFQLIINDLQAPSNQSPGGAIWVQAWYRDPAGDGTALSNAVQIEFH